MRVELTIEQLVLLGFDPLERHRIGDALERELAARIGQADLSPSAWTHVGAPYLRAPDAHILPPRAATTSSEDLARGIAGSIGSLLARVPSATRGTTDARTAGRTSR